MNNWFDTCQGQLQVMACGLDKSSCSNFIYSSTIPLRFWSKDGWTYNETTKQLLLVRPFNKNENTTRPHDWEPEVGIEDEIILVSIPENTMVLGVKEEKYNRTSEEVHEWLEFKKVK